MKLKFFLFFQTLIARKGGYGDEMGGGGGMGMMYGSGGGGGGAKY